MVAVSGLGLQMKLKYLNIITTNQIYFQENPPSPGMSFFVKWFSEACWLQYMQIHSLSLFQFLHFIVNKSSDFLTFINSNYNVFQKYLEKSHKLIFEKYNIYKLFNVKHHYNAKCQLVWCFNRIDPSEMKDNFLENGCSNCLLIYTPNLN